MKTLSNTAPSFYSPASPRKWPFADNFTLIAEKYFANPAPGQPQAITGTLAPGLQIFFGLLRLGRTWPSAWPSYSGFHFPENFRAALYLASSITEFPAPLAHFALHLAARLLIHPVRRQSTGPWRTYRNLLITMLLGGLWHGASWNFVIWGGYHAACC